jgi:membrane protein
MIKTAVKKLKPFVHELFDDTLTYYASSLSFYTIFTIIPLLLITLTLFTSMPGFDDIYANIKGFIFSNLMPTQTETVSSYLDGFLQNSAKLGVVGLIYVLFASMMFFKNYEYIVAQIFKTKTRGFWNALTTYWTMITLMPIALTVSFFLSGKIQRVLVEYNLPINFLEIFPYLIIWALFFVIYKISANTNISTKAAAFSSFVASLAWYIAKTAFVTYAFYNQTYMSIYGSFSILLFFFLWIYLSWVIVLYGLRLCKILHHQEKVKEQKQADPSAPTNS